MTAVAKKCNVRLLSIKGPLLVSQDLRDERSSADVDVLVHPADVDRLVPELEAMGWEDHTPYEMAWLMPRHSKTFRNSTWPCELDVHSHFPGLLADPTRVFERLWSRRTDVILADHALSAPDQISHALIAGLHYLRDINDPGKAEQFEALGRRLDRMLSASDRAEMAEVAVQLGASRTAEPLLQRLGVAVESHGEIDEAELRYWHEQVSAVQAPGHAWMILLRRASWRHKPRILWKAVILPEAELRRLAPDLPLGRQGLWLGRARRVRRGAYSVWSRKRSNRLNRREER